MIGFYAGQRRLKPADVAPDLRELCLGGSVLPVEVAQLVWEVLIHSGLQLDQNSDGLMSPSLLGS